MIFPIKSCSFNYVIHVGICLLMCSGKLCCVLNFGDSCFRKFNFQVGMYERGFVAVVSVTVNSVVFFFVFFSVEQQL